MPYKIAPMPYLYRLIIPLIVIFLSIIHVNAQVPCNNCDVCYDASGTTSSSCANCTTSACFCWWPQDTIPIDNSGDVTVIADDIRAGDFAILTNFQVNATYEFTVSDPSYWLTVYYCWGACPGGVFIAHGTSPLLATPAELADGLMSLHINTSGPASGCGVTAVAETVTAEVRLVDSCDLDYIMPDVDNCPCVTNPLQTDSDNDGIGDVCEPGYENVGISVAEPLSKLHIRGGQVFVEDTVGALIMMAPDSTCWRLSVDISGDLITTQVDCLE